jgi:hypothetical protein
VNVVIGFGLAIVAQAALFPVLDLTVSAGENVLIGSVFTVLLIAMSFLLRRAFEVWRIRQIKATNSK